MGQTQVLDDDAVLFGSAKIELGLYSGGLAGLVDIGAANGVTFTFPPKQEIVKFDNTEEWKRYSNADAATINGTIFEVSADTVAKLLSGTAKRTVVAGDPTAVTDEHVILTGTAMQRLAHKNGAGTEVASIVVTNSTGTVTYDRATDAAGGDYVVALDAGGNTCIARTADSTIVSGATVYVDYSYTPNDAVQVDVGGILDQDYLIARLTNTRPSDSKIYQITCWKVALGGDLKWTYAPDESLQPNGLPITLEAIKDQTRPNGEQLFRLYDEQSVVA